MRIRGKEFKVTKEMKEVIRELGEPYAAGIYMEFPSLHALITSQVNFPRVFVDDHAEQLFLYGRDVFLRSIIRKEAEEGIVIVCNKRGEPLGFGKFGKRLIKNIADLGMYLREED